MTGLHLEVNPPLAQPGKLRLSIARPHPQEPRRTFLRFQASSDSPDFFKFDGHAKSVLQELEKDLRWAIPSAGGGHLAIWEASGNSNAWLVSCRGISRRSA